jgi:hypothetical protein
MPQLVKGAKWAYGWVVLSQHRNLRVPPQAWCEYGLRAGDEAIFTPGSKTSGGFGLSTPGLVDRTRTRVPATRLRTLARGRLGHGEVTIPAEVDVKAGDWLLAVRGSRYAIGFVARGPIFQEAHKHPDLEVFSDDDVSATPCLSVTPPDPRR